MKRAAVLISALLLAPAASFAAGPFVESDFHFDAYTAFFKDIIIAGVNKVAAENPKCAMIDPASATIAPGRGNPDNPVFYVVCGEPEHEAKVYFSKVDVTGG